MQLQCLTCFSNYLAVFLETIASEKPLYIADPLRLNPDLYVQVAFVEMQAPLAVQKALKRAFSRG